jgi:branched-chain amino acid transport system permease protein
VADDHQATLSVGVSLNFIWILVWSLAGLSPWSLGDHVRKTLNPFSLSLIALKALPVLMLGGFHVHFRGIVGGLIIGVELFEF